MRVFLSFSGQDSIAVRRLMLELVRHRIQVWDYSRPEERIPAGDPIPQSLTDRVAAADAVVVLMSQASAPPASTYTAMEVSAALAANRPLIPVILKESPPRELSEPFARLAARRLRHVSLWTEPKARFATAMVDLFAALGLPYRPPVVAHRRLPVLERFESELAAHDVTLPHATFSDLGLILQEFADRYAVGDWDAARSHIQYFCDSVAYRQPKLRLYYPVVVKGVCELHLADYGAAERTFSSVLGHSAVDENAFTGHGHALYWQGSYAAAAADYAHAAEIARACGRSDVEIQINRLTALLEMGAAPDEAVLHGAFTTVLEADLPKIQLLKAIALQKRDDLNSAIHILMELAARSGGEVRDVAVTHLADDLLRVGRPGEAIAHLRRWLRDASLESSYWLRMQHQLARLYTDTGDFESALRTYGDVLCVAGAWTRQFLVEQARLLLVLGEPESARQVCERVCAAEPFGLPQTQYDYYYFGFALFLSGKREAADAYFSLAGDTYPHYRLTT